MVLYSLALLDSKKFLRIEIRDRAGETAIRKEFPSEFSNTIAGGRS